MKLNTKALAITSSLLWGGAVLTVGLINLAKPSYGRRFLEMIGSVYPGYHANREIRDLATGTAYALLDGAVGGAVIAGVYNSVDARVADNKRSLRAA